MPATAHFLSLQKEASRLKKLLPKPNLYGNYTDLSVRKIIAFRVLSHAALETYFEDISQEILKKCHADWTANRRANFHLLSLLIRYSRVGGLHDSAILELQKKALNELVEKATKWHEKNISDNHGVRENNLSGLFVPFGNSVLSLFHPVLPLLEPYAAIRGKYAHTSAATVAIPNPSDEFQAIGAIINDLAPVDINLEALISSL